MPFALALAFDALDGLPPVSGGNCGDAAGLRALDLAAGLEEVEGAAGLDEDEEGAEGVGGSWESARE